MKISGFVAIILALVVSLPVAAAERHDSVVFLVDVSGTVSDEASVSQAKKVLMDMNQRFPSDVESSGILSFGNQDKPQLNWLMPVMDYDRNGIDRTLSGLVEGNGPTPIGAAIGASAPGVEKAKGKTALIIVSDGLDTGASDPVEKVEAMKKEHGPNLCVFTIQLGNEVEGERLLADLVQAGGCGKGVSASSLNSDTKVQALVDFIFPGPGYRPPPKPVEPTRPRPGDEDGDGVLDPDDNCPGTPAGARVDMRGCWVLKNVRFDSGSAAIQSRYTSDLDNVVTVLERNPDLSVVVEGHTDSQGAEENNQTLSQKRAEAVMNYFIAKGISRDRLSAKGYGELKPIADNETAEGRAQNRRIELKPVE